MCLWHDVEAFSNLSTISQYSQFSIYNILYKNIDLVWWWYERLTEWISFFNADSMIFVFISCLLSFQSALLRSLLLSLFDGCVWCVLFFRWDLYWCHASQLIYSFPQLKTEKKEYFVVVFFVAILFVWLFLSSKSWSSFDRFVIFHLIFESIIIMSILCLFFSSFSFLFLFDLFIENYM